MKFTDISNEDDESLVGGNPQVPYDPLFHVVLVEPEIPQNTGNIGRTCVGMQAHLHLVGPLGFKITDRNLKRAGLDYWQHLQWQHHLTYQVWEDQVLDLQRVFYFSAKAERSLYDQTYQKGDHFVFGRETKGLDDMILQRNRERCLLIPILGPVRGYNVATSAAMVLTEAYRQIR